MPCALYLFEHPIYLRKVKMLNDLKHRYVINTMIPEGQVLRRGNNVRMVIPLNVNCNSILSYSLRPGPHIYNYASLKKQASKPLPPVEPPRRKRIQYKIQTLER